MRIDTTRVFHSKNSEYQDVTFILRKPTEGRRIQLLLSLADARSRFRTMLAELRTLAAAEEGETKPAPAEAAKAEELTDRIQQVLSAEINPAWIRWGLASVEHLDFDGTPADVESFLANAPSDLYKELVTAIQAEAGLSSEEVKN